MMQGAHYPEETVQLAFEVWAFLAARNVRRVARLLQSDYEIDVPVRTLYDWEKRYNWAEQMEQRIHDLAPSIHRQTVAELVFGSLEGARTLRRSVQDDVPDEERPDKNQIMAATVLLDRAGFSPLGRFAPRAPDKVGAVGASIDVESLSIEDAYELQFKMLSDLSSSLVKQQR